MEIMNMNRIKHLNIKKLVLCLGLMLSLAFVATTAYAEIEFNSKKYSDREKVGFGFYKLAGIPPNFKNWIINTAEYANTPKELRAIYLQEQAERLEEGFEEFDLKENPLTFSLPARVTFPNIPERESIIANGDQIPVEIEIKNFEDGILPYLIGESWIGVLPGEFHKHALFYLTGHDFAVFANNLGMDMAAQGWDVALQLVLLPARANIDAPIKRKGKDIWTMDTHVASMVLWRAYGKKYVWKIYEADWYHGEDSVNLLDLYRK